MLDIQLKLDKLIEERIYNRFKPIEDATEWWMDGWSKEPDGRYHNYTYVVETGTSSLIDAWPRHFSTCMQLAWELAEKFMIQMIPFKHIDGSLSGWLAKRGEVEVEDESATMAICLLVALLTKNDGR